MTDIYTRDLFGMKFSILKSPYHTKVVTACSEMLGIPPMKMRRRLIENLDMMTLESLGVRYDSWLIHGDKEQGIRREIGYDLFTSFIPIISREIMEKTVQSYDDSEEGVKQAKGMLRRLVFEEGGE